MPTSRFTTTALRQAAPGLSRLAMALGGGQEAYQRGAADEETRQGRIAQALSQIRQNDAQADHYTAQAAQQRAETENLSRRPEQRMELAALSSGQGLPLVRALMEATRNGAMPTIPGQVLDGPNADGSAGVPARMPDDVQSKIAQALVRLAPVGLNQKDFGVDDWAKAQDRYRDMDLSQGVLDGSLDRNKVAGAQAASAGKNQYNADASGSVLDLFSGALNTDNPMARATISLKGDQGKAQQASAAQSYAAADSSRASADKTRAEMRDGVNRGGAKAPTGYRWGSDGTSLEPIPGGPADPATKGAKLAKPPTEGQAKALLFGSRMAIADEIFQDLAKAGSDTPSWTKQAVEEAPLIGSGLGNAANFMFAGPDEQRVEQAQRDFINAVLRRESGAAIADSEFANARRQYFPQPGDSAAVKAQKAANRKAVIQGFKAEFGEPLAPDFERIVGEARAGRQPKKRGQPQATAPAASGANRTVEVDF